MDVAVGDIAPAFTLPVAQGGTRALVDRRGHNVILWFTKGFGCPFCRQQMSQLARARDKFGALDAELWMVTPTALRRAEMYARRFALPFPYLCDSGDTVRHRYGVRTRRRPLSYYATKLLRRFRRGAPSFPDTQYGATRLFGAPAGMRAAPRELMRVIADDDAGLFVVDRAGTVHYADIGPFRSEEGRGPLRHLPTNEELVTILERCV